MNLVSRLKQKIRRFRRALAKQNQNRLEVLLYHFVTDDDHPFTASGHNVRPKDFERQLLFLRDHYEILPLEDAPARLRRKSIGSKPALGICFDDGYQSNLTEAWPILERLGIPATIFICGSVVGNADLLWRDKIRYLIDQNQEQDFVDFLRNGDTSGRYCFETLERLPFYRWSKSPAAIFGDTILTDLDRFFKAREIDAPRMAAKYNLFVSEDDLRERREGLRYANHTWSHPLMTLFGREQQASQIRRNHDWLVERGIETKLLAMPFTQFDDNTVSVCEELDYDAFFTVLSQSNAPGQTGNVLTIHRWMAPPTAAELRAIL